MTTTPAPRMYATPFPVALLRKLIATTMMPAPQTTATHLPDAQTLLLIAMIMTIVQQMCVMTAVSTRL